MDELKTSVIANIISRIDSLEKRDGANMNEKIGRIENEPYFDPTVIREYADLFRENLLELQ